jgi:hypothetical protein
MHQERRDLTNLRPWLRNKSEQRILETVNSKTQTPVRVIMLCGILLSLVAGFIPLGDLAELFNIGTLRPLS